MINFLTLNILTFQLLDCIKKIKRRTNNKCNNQRKQIIIISNHSKFKNLNKRKQKLFKIINL